MRLDIALVYVHAKQKMSSRDFPWKRARAGRFSPMKIVETALKTGPAGGAFFSRPTQPRARPTPISDTMLNSKVIWSIGSLA